MAGHLDRRPNSPPQLSAIRLRLPASAALTLHATSPPPGLPTDLTYDAAIAALIEDLPTLPSSDDEETLCRHSHDASLPSTLTTTPGRRALSTTTTIHGTPTPSLSSHDGSPEPEDTRGSRHNSPELGESAPSRQVSEFASRTIPPGSTSAAFTALAALSTVRSMFIKNTESFSLSRPANAEAWAAQHVGKEASSPCGHCVKRLGPFGGQPCVIVVASKPLGGKPVAPGRRKGKKPEGKKPKGKKPKGKKPEGKKPEKKAASSAHTTRTRTCTRTTTTHGCNPFSPGPDTPPQLRTLSPTMSGALPPPSRSRGPATPRRSRIALELARALPPAARAARHHRLSWALLALEMAEDEEKEKEEEEEDEE
ncbi:hypothetical protein GMDG_07795 [Pseudogymnoascus destructans 20631-21]|uniref:Uncharacterized protein n=1 Tax=Pseudogymnoascus destructans (strain ATCC MYA-4855 / 20631-21) TaxID=658429 RepID=L8G011_PSED2|nr:hypothetical protein GMDG_07795 [Pseudogymnoascus destructans 20631-21]